MGLVVLIYGLARLGESVGPRQALVFGVALAAGGAIIYSFWLILATLSFWFVRVENMLVIFQSMYQAGRWPVSIYPPWLRWGLTVPGAGGLRHHGTSRGADRTARWRHARSGHPGRGGHDRPLTLVLVAWGAAVFGGVGVGKRSSPGRPEEA